MNEQIEAIHFRSSPRAVAVQLQSSFSAVPENEGVNNNSNHNNSTLSEQLQSMSRAVPGQFRSSFGAVPENEGVNNNSNHNNNTLSE